MLRNLLAASAAALILGVAVAPAQALTMQECSTKYQAAKKANSLKKGQTWNDFRKSECDDDDADDNAAASVVKEDPKPARAAAPAAPARANAPAPAATAPAAPAAASAPARATAPAQTTAAPATAPAAAPKPTGRIAYPRAVDKEFANEKPGLARLHTCAKQYNANKASNANGGLNWIQEGGGYWSLCNKRLKESAA